MPDRHPQHCPYCPAQHRGNDCPCSRQASAKLARFLWDSLCCRIRSMDAGEWLVAALCLIAVAAVWSAR